MLLIYYGYIDDR